MYVTHVSMRGMLATLRGLCEVRNSAHLIVLVSPVLQLRPPFPADLLTQAAEPGCLALQLSSPLHRGHHSLLLAAAYCSHAVLCRRHPPSVECKGDLEQWVCTLHNDVNSRLDKPAFNCRFVRSRWQELDCDVEHSCSLEGLKRPKNERPW